MDNENLLYGTSGSVDAQIDNVASDVHSTTDAAAKKAHALVDRAVPVARESEERIRQTATSAESSLQQTLDTARTKSTEVSDSIIDFVRQHPIASLTVAFSGGVLLSYLTRGKRAAERDADTD